MYSRLQHLALAAASLYHLADASPVKSTPNLTGRNIAPRDHRLSKRDLYEVVCGFYPSADWSNTKKNESNLGGKGSQNVPIKAQSCNRVGCYNTSGVYACNDQDVDIDVPMNEIVDLLGDLLEYCFEPEEAVEPGNGSGRIKTDARGGYNVNAGYCNGNDSPAVPPSGYGWPGPNGEPIVQCGKDDQPPCEGTQFPIAIMKNFPDPGLTLGGDGNYYAYSTANGEYQLPVAKSSDGFTWEYQQRDALEPGSIKWAPENPQVWAVDVVQGSDGKYNMYYTAIASSTGDAAKHCIGFAQADDPLGPFVPTSDEPWVCNEETGDIDPEQFQDEDGTRYVLWKVDGNSAGQDTPIMLQQVEDDGYTKVGDAVEILNRDEEDGPLVEAPSLVKVDGIYYLTFSSNMYDTELYCTSYATATDVAGPYTKAKDPDAPIITSDMMDFYGPGGADMLYRPGEQSLILFHGWDSDQKKERYTYAAGVDFVDGKIKVAFAVA